MMSSDNTEKLRSNTESPQQHAGSLSSSPSPLASGMKNGSSDCEESSLSTSSQGNTSTTLRDALSNCSNGYVNSSGGGTSDQEKHQEKSKAVFDKVVLDAMQRHHIRTKRVRSTEDDTGSDSSSGTQDMPLPLKQEVKTRAEQKKTPSHNDIPKNSGSDTGISSGQADLTSPHDYFANFGHSSKPSRHSSRGHVNLKRTFHRLQDKHRADDDGSSSSSSSDHEMERKRKRFFRTFSALRDCGLMEITMQTASLMERNKQLQKQIMFLRMETSATYNQMAQLCKENPDFGKSQNTKQVMQSLSDILSNDGPSNQESV